jgi:hypothetical protein
MCGLTYVCMYVCMYVQFYFLVSVFPAFFLVYLFRAVYPGIEELLFLSKIFTSPSRPVNGISRSENISFFLVICH